MGRKQSKKKNLYSPDFYKSCYSPDRGKSYTVRRIITDLPGALLRLSGDIEKSILGGIDRRTN